MRKILATLFATVWIGGAALVAAEQSWTGKISDSICGASHKAMAELAGVSDRDCTLQCIDSRAKYVFVDESQKVLQIANQDFADLKTHANHAITLTGELKGETITVLKIEMKTASK